MTVLGFQVQRQAYPGWLVELAQRCKPCWVKLINPAETWEPLGPGLKYLARFHWGVDEPDRKMVFDGAAGAAKWAEVTLRRLQRVAYCKYVEGPNELHLTTTEQAKQVAEFDIAAARRCREYGYTYIGSSHGVGWPQFGLVPILAQAWHALGFLNVHEYELHDEWTWDGATIGRHRELLHIAEMSHVDTSAIKVVLGEYGYDRNGQRYDGWRCRPNMSDERYANELAANISKAAEDPRVVAVLPFTVSPEGDWKSFEMTERVTRMLVDKLAKPQDLHAQIDAALRAVEIPQNVASAFYVYGRSHGWEPMSGETDVNGYRCQRWYSPEDQIKHAVYCKVGDWGNVSHFDTDN